MHRARAGGRDGPAPRLPRLAEIGNYRNGSSAKTVATRTGKLRIDIPRDRGGGFEPLLIA